MIGSFRAGRWAGALAFFTLIATSSNAAASSRVEQTFAAPATAPAWGQVSPLYATPAVQPLYSAPAPAQPQPYAVPGPAPAPAAPVARSLGEMVASFINRGDQDAEELCL